MIRAQGFAKRTPTSSYIEAIVVSGRSRSTSRGSGEGMFERPVSSGDNMIVCVDVYAAFGSYRVDIKACLESKKCIIMFSNTYAQKCKGKRKIVRRVDANMVKEASGDDNVLILNKRGGVQGPCWVQAEEELGDVCWFRVHP